MEIRITATSASVSFGKTGFGVNGFTGTYIETRPTKGAPQKLYGIVKGPALGSSTGSFVASHVQTDWFSIRTNAELFRTPGKLAGKTLDIKLTGALVGGGKVDVTINLIDDTGNIETVTAKADISSSGVQAASTRIRGKVKYLPEESKAA